MQQRSYRVHQAATISVETARRIYRRHCVEMEAPSYVERRLKGGDVVERLKLVAPGYVMVPDTATVTPNEINAEAGRAIVYRAIGTLEPDALDRMKSTPADDQVPTKLTIRKGSRVQFDIFGTACSGRVMRMTGTKAVVRLDGKFSGGGAVEVPFTRLSVIDDSTAAQLHPGS